MAQQLVSFPIRTWHRQFVLLAGLAFGAVAGAASAPTEPAVRLAIDAARPGAVINRHVFGQFAEHLGAGIYGGVWVGRDSPIPNTRGIRNDVVAALRAIKVPNVRWPGGCFADYYHWRNGIGRDRAVTLNPDWGGVTEPNTFGTHEFMDFAAQIGAAPFLSINLGSGTVQEAADWMEYITSAQATTLARERAANGRAEPWQVPLLGLGNESWDCGGNMTPEFYVDQMKMHARFARNFHPQQQEGAGRMLRIAVGPGGGEPRFVEWTETVMKAWADRKWSWDIEGISLHNYTVINWDAKHVSVGFDERGYAEILQKTLQMDGLIRQHAAIMNRYDPQKRLALAVDEWGAWYAPLPGSNPGFLVQQHSVRDAVLAALNLNIFARHADRVRIANIAQMVNVLQAMIVTDGAKMLLTPTYHVFRMYVPFQDATFLPVSMEAGLWTHGSIALPRLDAIAARDAGGRVWLALTNIDPARELQVDAALTGFTARSASGETLTGPAVDSINTFAAPAVVAPRPLAARIENGRLQVTLPAKSVSVIELRP